MADTVTYGRDPNGSLVKVPLSSPVGAVFFFAKSTPPEHALACDGAAVSRAAYPELFGAIGTTFGAGDGSTTFNLPDLRGRFIRGTGGQRGGAGSGAGGRNPKYYRYFEKRIHSWWSSNRSNRRYKRVS